ncbi:hypothetical protein KBW81_03470 [Loktanella salsilacus]|uniref:3'-5' exonuclease n=1 Tax=Loktanella salsilacus TaxID=195913 RepID=UPI0020B8A8CF|nr:exonuclease domain-containing protein [Loktanella salsilacus]UTH48873.1 hypothetical protein KBW81_03470 [Loktanella salsilacus]
MKIDDIIFIDFEASSLSAQSWPIEVGLAWIVSGSVKTWSSLIRPHYNWDEVAWSEQSADIHGIPRNTLDTAPSADVVAEDTARRLEGKIVVSDAPEHDYRWAEMLGNTIGVQLKPFADFDAAVGTFCAVNPKAVSAVFAHLEATPSPHRAGLDAARLALAILKGISAAK